MRKVLTVLLAPFRAVWRPLQSRLVGRHFTAVISRLDSTLGELHNLKSALESVQCELAEFSAAQDTLSRQVGTVVADRWDLTAVARRLAVLEDRVLAAEESTSSATTGGTDADRDAPEPAVVSGRS
ncbi:MAG TPA: hypothetical protein VNV42_02915 [Solirubrobacteraceae bacterium]|jgi:hypothetical protein|nr:hypothetical protein [Solirubrobacteraceae bacterium]